MASHQKYPQHFIYPLTQGSGYVFGQGGQITPENFWKSAVNGGTDEWSLATGFKLISPGDVIWAYFGGKVRRIYGVGTVQKPVGWREDWDRYTVFIRWDAALTRRLQESPIAYEDYRQQVQAATVRAKPATLKVLNAWLRKEGGAGDTGGLGVKFARREVLQRLGQQAFNAAAKRAYRGECAITACGEPAVLQAAHIVPVQRGGSHAISNSVLLRSDLHLLFDFGMLRVSPKLKVIIVPEVKDRRYRQLNGTNVSIPTNVPRSEMIRAFTKHRESFEQLRS